MNHASASSLVELLSCDLVGGFCCGLIAGGDSFTGGANGSLQAGLHGHVALVGLLVGENALLLDLRNYLLKATKNAALDHLRKHRHERVRTEEENETDVPDSEEMPDDALVEKIHNRIEYKKIVSAIASMGDIYRDALYYHFVLELSVPETAKLLNCKVSTVKQRLVRGKKLLHVQLFERGEQ